MKITRRTLFRAGLSAGAGLYGSILTRFGHLSALTPPSDDYRALVCVFLFGGNDTNNLVVPLDTTAYKSYSDARKTLALAPEVLLPLQAGTSGSFGFHPKMVELQKLYNGGNLAVVANVGTLVRPLTRQQYLATPTAGPANLFSHSDQQLQWQSSVPQGTGLSGWGGRLADQMGYLNGTATLPMMVSVAGNALFGSGEHSRAATVIPGGTLGLQGYSTSAASQARLQSLNELLTFDGGFTLVQQSNSVLKKGLADSAALAKALAGAPGVTTPFPAGNSLATQLLQIAKIIQVRKQLGVTRQIFFCSLGGFDTHSNQLVDQDTLLGRVSQALAAFYQATQELGVEGNVTTFTESDFSRTMQPNTNGGSDHAWGSHHLVLGGGVDGGRIYGTFPNLQIGGPDDSGSAGRWIPTTATDQYGATLSRWFGLSPQLLPSVFPNIGNFGVTDLRFVV